MSYCRWSCDNFRSDVYVYAHVDGTWTTHVAGNKIVGDVPPVPWVGEIGKSVSIEEYQAASHVRSAFLEKAERPPIGLPHDGKTFKDPTPAACKATLLMLRDLGYYVPAHALEGLDDDMADQSEIAS